MSIYIRKVTIADLEKEPNVHDLLAEYSEECAMEGLPSPVYKVETYKALESTGWLHIYAAYQSPDLIGFIFVLGSVLPHYSVPIATVETFFVSKKHRKSGAGLHLLHRAETLAKEICSPGLLVSAPIGGDLAKVLERSRKYIEKSRVFLCSFS